VQDVFVTRIKINRVRHLSDLEITLAKDQRRHLILTDKNGSGKTSLLEAMRKVFLSLQRKFT
jgi:predicted ATP-binding protein involved in virulence